MFTTYERLTHISKSGKKYYHYYLVLTDGSRMRMTSKKACLEMLEKQYDLQRQNNMVYIETYEPQEDTTTIQPLKEIEIKEESELDAIEAKYVDGVIITEEEAKGLLNESGQKDEYYYQLLEQTYFLRSNIKEFQRDSKRGIKNPKKNRTKYTGIGFGKKVC